jgi:hypothetical protein
MPMLSLFLAAFWMALCVGLIVLDFFQTETGLPALDENRRKVAALAFVLFGYNLFRYRLTKTQSRLRQEANSPPPRPRRVDEDRPVDPTFDFCDKPEKPPSP